MRARKRFGQHFLEPAWQTKVIAACRVSPTDDVVEIGPGRGALTLPLVERAAHVLAVEVDRDLAAALEARALPTLQVVTGDFLRQDWEALMAAWRRPVGGPVRVVGNLPYNVSSPILFRLLEIAATHPEVHDATLMLQAEVAERLSAAAGTRDYGVLTLLTALGADVEPLLALPAGRIPAGPRGSFGLGPTRLPPAAARCDPPGAGHAVGPQRVHPTAQDDRQRAEGAGHGGRRRSAGAAAGRRRRPAPPARDAAAR